MVLVPSDPESSFELIERARTGDRDALERLLERYRPRLRRWAIGRLPPEPDARSLVRTEDIVQDVLLRTVRQIGQAELRGEWALQAYLRRAVIMRLREARADGEPGAHGARGADDGEAAPLDPLKRDELPAFHRSPLAEIVGTPLFARYNEALAQLADVDREAVIARLELGCSYEEISLLVDVPAPDDARSTVSRALARLAELMSASRPA